MVKVTRRQHDTLIAVRDRARAMKAAGNGSSLMAVSDSEYKLAKKKFQELVASGVEIPENALAIAKKMGFIE